jgi:enediyne biosynthesis protein E4
VTKKLLLVTVLILAAGCSICLLSGGVPEPSHIRFRDVAQSAKLNFVLNNNPTPQKHMVETMAGGVAAFDYNGDGLPDIFFTNGATIRSLQKESPKYWNRLYRNEGGMKFTDVTEQAGVAGAGYSMGVAAGDFDNDGRVDLFVAGVYRNLLYRNRGDGKFEDATAKSLIKSDKWSVAAGWFDYDNDGLLDLLVVNYAKWTPDFNQFCGDATRNIRVYCHPKYFAGVPNQLYHNRGDGTFEDVSERAGIAEHIGRGMSVAFADYDGDGFTDIFVTNDNLPNSLFHNRGDGTFEEVGLTAGVALPEHGRAIASMGADFRDYDNDGLPDIAVTALTGDTFPLFRNNGHGSFEDVTYSSQIGPQTIRWSGWGNGLFDFDDDTYKDLFTANSHVNDRIDSFEATPYKQANRVFKNLGNGKFQDVSGEAGPGFDVARAHRGSAFADFNGDGKIDVVVSSLGEPAELWENVGTSSNHWLILRLIGSRSNRDGIGARICIGRQSNLMTSAVSYASSSYSGVHFGLGQTKQIDAIKIRWPSGTVQVLSNVKADQVLEVREPKT